MVINKKQIAYLILFMIVCYIISPWFFEKKLLFNELLSAVGLVLLAFKRFKVGTDTITRCVIFLLFWGMIHAVVSIPRADAIYYYLRNLVIIYSVLTFFIGYYIFPYLAGFVRKFHQLLRVYIGIFLLVPVSKFMFERFGMSTLFPSLVKNLSTKWYLPFLIGLNFIYSITYSSLTAIILAVFYVILLIVPGYKFFKQSSYVLFFSFAIVFVFLIPGLSTIAINYSYNDNQAIYQVMDSHPLLGLDGNSTWRLVLWKQIIVDHFPTNIFGMGFGTPILKYFPIEDFTKVPQLPYILGAHNSFVYLFGRLGIVYVVLMLVIYRHIFKEYFYFKSYYYKSKGILVFWSFFAISIVAAFNPVLESPIFSGSYWFFLGLLVRVINQRTTPVLTTSTKSL